MEEIDKNAAPKSTKDFAVGSVVLEKFEVLEFIATGGKGRVYKVRDLVLNNVVALKVLIVDSKSEKALVRFQSEARTSSKLNHPNIATIFDFGLSDGTPFISMEFVDGETLEALCASMTRIPLPFFLEIFIQVCNALVHAHGHGIVHRDLKPDNIAVRTNVDNTICAKILDFGVAKQIDFLVGEESRLTPTGEIVGTPLFMSPEQAGGERATPESDLYSLGCMMWFCLTGKHPVRGKTAMETVVMQQKTTPPPLNVAFPELNLPENLCDCINALLSKDPKLRPSLKYVVLPNLLTLQEMTESPPPQNDPELGTVGNTTKKQSKRIAWIVLPAGAFVLITASLLLFIFPPRWGNVETPAATQPEAALKAELFIDSDGDPTYLERKKYEIQSVNKLLILLDATDEDLKSTKLDTVEKIDLTQGLITDKVFESLSRASKLKQLRLSGTQVTTLNGIEQLKNLEVLELNHTNISDASLDHVASLRNLRKLDLSETSVTDAAFPKLALLTQLNELCLNNTKVTGSTSSCLHNLKKLISIELVGAKCTKQGVSEIARLPAIMTLGVVYGPDFTPSDVKQLKKEYPCIVFGKYGGELQDLKSEAKRALRHGNKQKAQMLLRACIELLQKQYGDESARLLNSYLDLADWINAAGDNKLAKELLKKVETIARRKQDDVSLLFAMEKQNTIDVGLLGFKAVEPTLLRTHHLAERRLSQKDLADRCQRLGALCQVYGHYERALQFYQQQMDIHRKISGDDDDKTAEILVSIGDCNRRISINPNSPQNSQAYDCYKKAIAIMSRTKPESASSKAVYCCAYAGLAQIETVQNHFDRGIEYNDKAFEILKDSPLNPESRATLIQQRINLFSLTKRDDEVAVLTQEYMNLRKAHPRLPKLSLPALLVK